MYAACLIITSAVLGVDFGYQTTDQGQLECVVQIEPEALERLKAGEAIQVGIPPQIDRIEVFRIQVGSDSLNLPVTYEKPVSDRANDVGLIPTEAPKLTSPPEVASEADIKPSLGDELAQYIPRSTNELPYGATQPATGASSHNTTNPGSTTATNLPPIPGADERYGNTASNGSRFSVPNTPGSPYNAVQTSGTTPITPTAGTSTTPGSTPTSGNQYSTTGSPTGGAANNSAAVNGTENRWNTSSGTNTGSTAGTPTQTGGTTAGTTGATNPYRFNNQTTTGSNNNSGVVSPSDSWVGQSGSGTGNSTNTGGTQNGTNNGNMAPPLNNSTGGYNYGTGSQQQPQQPNNNNNTTPNNGVPNFDNSWLTGAFGNNNQQNGGTTAPYSPLPNTNQQQQGNGQVGQQPPYGQQYPNNNYNNQQQMPPQQQYGPYPNNNYANQVPYNQYGNQPNYGYNVPASYQQPYMQPPVQQVASLPPPASSPTQTTGTTTGDAKETEKEIVYEKVTELPTWWPLLAFGALISFGANFYMFTTSQEFRRKYQDLLEDVRDLRTLSND
ncbi:hypothetical protein [Bremerella cremea]|uniref:hypothetical protein n=1 Tax=Bremerella cremea TaxID=1031537 RepID=UPI0031EF20C1